MLTEGTFLGPTLTSDIPFRRELEGESFDIRIISVDFEEEKKFQVYWYDNSLPAAR